MPPLERNRGFEIHIVCKYYYTLLYCSMYPLFLNHRSVVLTLFGSQVVHSENVLKHNFGSTTWRFFSQWNHISDSKSPQPAALLTFSLFLGLINSASTGPPKLQQKFWDGHSTVFACKAIRVHPKGSTSIKLCQIRTYVKYFFNSVYNLHWTLFLLVNHACCWVWTSFGHTLHIIQIPMRSCLHNKITWTKEQKSQHTAKLLGGVNPAVKW